MDSRGLAGAAARAFSRPALFLFGEPSADNAHNNLLKALPIGDRPEMILLRVRHATHRAFENRTDPERGRSGGLETIRCLATAWVLASTGVDPTGAKSLNCGGKPPCSSIGTC